MAFFPESSHEILGLIFHAKDHWGAVVWCRMNFVDKLLRIHFSSFIHLSLAVLKRLFTLITALVLIAWIVLGVQLCYLISFLVAFSRKRPEKGKSAPPVSVIVCAHDEEKNLRELVPQLLNQNYPQFEVIIVEDRCNDGTYDYLLETTKKDERLKMVRVQHLPGHLNGKKFALTLGIKAALNEWVLLTDADCRPMGREWIRAMASHFQEDKALVIGYSPYTKSTGYLNAFIRFEALMTGIQFIGWALLGRPYMGTGRNLGYRRSLFFDHKGFNKHLNVTGGDDDLFVNEHARRHNTVVCIDPGSIMPSIPKETWSEFFYQKFRHLMVGKRYKLSDKIILGVFSSSWILSWLLVFPAIFTPSGLGFYLWAGFLVREIALILVVYKGSRTLGDSMEAWRTPLLDFNYAIYYLGTGLVALVSKQVRWKK